jgi:hypothetical protein
MPQDEDLKSLDEMVAGFGTSRDLEGRDLVLEHLRAARRCLLGSMLGEYRFNLQQAREAVGFLPDKTVQAGAKTILLRLYDSVTSKPRRSAATGAGYALPSPAPLAPAV